MKRLIFTVLVAAAILVSNTLITSGAEERKILIIGDSHTAGTFGDELSRELARAINARVSRYGVVSSTVYSWMEHSRLASFQPGWTRSQVGAGWEQTERNKKGEPLPSEFNYSQLLGEGFDVVVIALGTNDVMSYCKSRSSSQPQTLRMIGPMTELVKGKTCIWVGPPPFSPNSSVIRHCGAVEYNEAVDRLIQEVMQSRCEYYIDSRDFKMPAEKENLFPSRPETCYHNSNPIYPDAAWDKDKVHFGALGAYWGHCTGLVINSYLQSK